MRKLFFEIDMTWKRTIIYAVITAGVVALLNLIPFLQGTSFAAPAETVEVWIILALVIICNSKTAKDAVLKTFVYFLISQPLIYLIEVPFNELGFGLFRYYPYWGFVTLLTIPGSFIAYQVKKDNIISSLVLSVATIFLFYSGTFFGIKCLDLFPRYLISTLFCFVCSIVLIFILLKNKKERLISLILTLIGGVTMGIIFNNKSNPDLIYILPEGEWSIVNKDVDVVIDKGRMVVTPSGDGKYRITIKDNNDNEKVIIVEVNGQDSYIYEENYEEESNN